MYVMSLTFLSYRHLFEFVIYQREVRLFSIQIDAQRPFAKLLVWKGQKEQIMCKRAKSSSKAGMLHGILIFTSSKNGYVKMFEVLFFPI